MRIRLSTALAVAAMALATALPARAADQKRPAGKRLQSDPAFAAVTDDPALPRVLLLGDSISIGYTPPVREALQGKANVHRAPTNCGPTIRGLEQLDQWLGDGRWDVIHFNFGLHDLKLIDGRHQVPIDPYEKNLRRIVERLEKTKAKLIWASTTPVPAGAEARNVEDCPRYNAVAAKIMAEQHVPIDDLYAFALPRLAKIQRPGNVHFTPEGYRAIAGQVAAAIEKSLEKPAKAAGGQ